ncbi:hypothetical protein ACWD4G_41485 [Streptomyces sp. NPDC002643]
MRALLRRLGRRWRTRRATPPPPEVAQPESAAAVPGWGVSAPYVPTNVTAGRGHGSD